ncbi:MAG: SpoVR family protein [Paracoccaceae bacterium]
MSAPLLFEGAEWSFADLRRAHDAIAEVAEDDLGLDLFRNQIEIISSEQMLDAYSSIGMPLMYRHWSFGKHFIQHEQLYRKGARGLAFEIVINSNPCICYCLEDNTMALQALVMAHAAFGHNHFFKNNYAFRQWTDPDGILDELGHARHFLAACEERYGREAVERVLDAAHALMPSSVFRHRRPAEPTPREVRERERRRVEEQERASHYLFDAMLPRADAAPEDDPSRERRREMRLPEENILYFLERHAPGLAPWQREVLRIVRGLAQYFYPQRQTKIMNEGCATFVHFEIMERLHRAGRIDDGAMLEILHNHANVLTQPDFDDPRFGGMNPYTLGFAMMRDIQRVCRDPSEEDRAWFPDIAGCGDWRGVLKDAWANYRDESFVRQFLSPKVMRDLGLFALADEAEAPYYTVTAIHDERGYRHLREAFAASCEPADASPEIEVVDADLAGDRRLRLAHHPRDGRPLDTHTREATLAHLRTLWGYEVVLEER